MKKLERMLDQYVDDTIDVDDDGVVSVVDGDGILFEWVSYRVDDGNANFGNDYRTVDVWRRQDAERSIV